MLKAAWGQLVYAQFGATPEKLEKLRESVLRLTKGWDQSEISEIVRDTLEAVIEPIVFDEALQLIRDHQAQGHKVFIVSASPEEVVAPIARLLGVDEAIATRAELDERRPVLRSHRALRVRRSRRRWPSSRSPRATGSTSRRRGPTPTPPPTCRCSPPSATRWP